ncbi:hypothetical protein ASPWEDRAFT_598538 [Aspergillus wentii DTO 134E9]|uniref:Uncharacterized protein n=1 Tax=Aspergillus wentii DTO 134E9 TaxID=1073089 RepID=A0A1L9RDK8_ASPWE|nr:uncharacterized protein ASPWEDRAFT_598538 [Aspergillus wentii DTO 134E9]OJJ32947.1 hypothetical protein ASPWEDRAFT_598538 [Aspergillus wentii DTO 134E9]
MLNTLFLIISFYTGLTDFAVSRYRYTPILKAMATSVCLYSHLYPHVAVPALCHGHLAGAYFLVQDSVPTNTSWTITVSNIIVFGPQEEDFHADKGAGTGNKMNYRSLSISRVRGYAHEARINSK